MKLVWSKTGDEIELEVLNQDLFYSWLDYINSKKANVFYCDRDSISDLHVMCRDLKDTVNKVNSLLARAKRSLPDTELVYSQAHLNLLHRRWVELQLDVTGIKSFLELSESGSGKVFDTVNELIHGIEHRSKLPFFSMSYHEFENPCTDIESMTSQPGHIFFSYKNLGRTSWHKYSFGDSNINDRDTNNWTVLSTDIVVDLTPIRPYTLPNDYIDLCKAHQVPAVGLELPLAKFPDPIDWMRLRTIFRKNILVSSNSFSFIS